MRWYSKNKLAQKRVQNPIPSALRRWFKPGVETLESRVLLTNSITGIVGVAQSGTPIDNLQPSANVRQAITIVGTELTLGSRAVFATTNQFGQVGTVQVAPTKAAADGSSMEVVVPDVAKTANLTIVGGAGSVFLQVVPTISDIDLTSGDFNTGSGFNIAGSGFVEGDMKIIFGTAEVVDTSVSAGPDIFGASNIGAGFDFADNDGISLSVPAGASPGPITVQTAGGRSAALPISVTQIVGAAVSGTPTSVTQASANPGQTIRILGGGFDQTTDIIFGGIDINGNLFNRAVNPDLVSVNRTMMEVRVPDDAITGSIRVIGAAGALQLQIVPTLKRVERQAGGGTQMYLLGSGFTENNSLSVNFGGTVVSDTGVSIEVFNSFLANDTLGVVLPAAGTSPVTVTTAGGTSAPVNIAFDDPASVGDLRDVAVFPTSSPDADKLVVAELNGDLKVLDPVTLATVRTITRPGGATSQIGLDFLGKNITVGATLVPAGSLIVVNAADDPDRLYYLNPTTGAILASLPLAGPSLLDEAGAVGVAYHPTRETLFVARSTDLITEINPATGTAIRSFHTGFGLSLSVGDIVVQPGTGNLIVADSGRRLLQLDAATGRLLGNYDLINNSQLGTVSLFQQGIDFPGFTNDTLTGLAFDNAGKLLATTYQQRLLTLELPGTPISIQVAGAMAVAADGVPADPLKPSANARQRIRITGAGYTRFTEVEFPRATADGSAGFVRVSADAVAADGSFVEVVVPDEAVSGRLRIAGAPGDGLFLQVTPTIRSALPADGAFNFDQPLQTSRLGVLGSGFIEAGTKVTIGGIVINDNSAANDIDIFGNAFRSNGRLDLTVPDRALVGPLKIETAGGSFQIDALPVNAQPSVGLTGIAATAGLGTPTNAGIASANVGQLITLQGYGFTTSSNILFTATAEDGTHSQVVARPTLVPNGGTMTVAVPAFAVTGPVTVSGSATSVQLQVVPTLNGISANSLTPGSAIRLSGTGIPEGDAGFNQQATYTFGPASVTDISPITGPDVFSAAGIMQQINLNVPVSASGNVVQVTTAGGTATLTLADVASVNVAAEPQGGGAADGWAKRWRPLLT